jgi:hypothetical protein
LFSRAAPLTTHGDGRDGGPERRAGRLRGVLRRGLALALLLASPAAGLSPVAGPAHAAPGESCVALRLRAWGRPGHAASLDQRSAPHRLIHGLGALLPAADHALGGVRIRALQAAARPNVKPATSAAIVEVTAPGTRRQVVARVRELLAAQEIVVETLDGPCDPVEPPAATTAG